MNSNNRKGSIEERQQLSSTVKSMHMAASSRALLAYRLSLLKAHSKQQDLPTPAIDPPLLLPEQDITLSALPSHPSTRTTTTALLGGSNNVVQQAPGVTAAAAIAGSMSPLMISADYEEAPPYAPIRTALEAAPVLPFKNQEGTVLQTKTMQTIGGSKSFPMVLHRALAELMLVPGGTDIAKFFPDGKSFQIKNQFLFETYVLPFFFPNMKSFASFQRQLNLYNFKRIAGAGVDRGAYRHDLFVREFPALSSQMKRKRAKKGGPHGTQKNKLRRAQDQSGKEFTSSPE